MRCGTPRKEAWSSAPSTVVRPVVSLHSCSVEIGLVVGVCSNVYPRYVDQNLPLLGLHRDLDFAATSYEAGALKPSRDVFDAAARKASHVNRLLHGRTQPDVAPRQVHTVHTLTPRSPTRTEPCSLNAVNLLAF